MHLTKLKISKLILIISALFLVLSISNYAQDREEEHHANGRHEGWQKHHEEEHHDQGLHKGWYKHSEKENWDRRDDDYREVRYRDNHYFFHRGEFYERRQEGYVVVTAPIGIRVNYLPRGYKIIRHRGIRFYLFGGIYYRYDPSARFYFVVKAPF